VAAVALAYQPHVPVPPEVDAAADRLVAACGGRTEESAARVCVLVQAHAAMLALIARLRAADGAPAVPVTRRIAPDGREILVDLAAAPFGAGRHACPGQALALHLATRQPGSSACRQHVSGATAAGQRDRSVR